MIDHLNFDQIKKKEKKVSYILKVIKFLIFRDFSIIFLNFFGILFLCAHQHG